MGNSKIIVISSLCLLIVCEGAVGSCGDDFESDPSFLIGRGRTCSVQDTQDIFGDQNIWLNWYDSDCNNEDSIRYNQDVCPTFIGMDLNFTCPEGAELHKVGFDGQVQNASMVIKNVQVEDAGMYECELVGGERMAYNVTVNAGKTRLYQWCG